MPQPYSLSLLGGNDLKREGIPANDLLVQSKVVALLAILAVPSVGRFVRRDTIVGMLWPELDQARARTALRKAVHSIRGTIGAEVLINRGDEELALSATHVESDVSAFMVATDGGFLLQALQLYKGDLMPGFHVDGCAEFERWLEDERAAIRERASAAAWALAQRFESEKQLTDAAGMARRAAKFSWSDERALRRALMMLDRVGDHSGAARLYEEFERRLKADLDMAPSPETVALIEDIRRSN
jgi:DNA-binding SARP family transcriptional activator